MNNKSKKAVSPIITTVLLILLALVLALIILLYFRGFLSEKIAKFIPTTGEERPISEACDAISLEVAIAGNNELSVINQGDIPLYKIGVRVLDSSTGDSNVKEYDNVKGLSAGQAIMVSTPDQQLSGNKVSVAAILIGKGNKDATKEYNCKKWINVA